MIYRVLLEKDTSSVPVVTGGTPPVLSGSIPVHHGEVQSGAGTRPRRQCNAKACSAVSPTTLPMVVSHSITMPPLCLPHSYYEVARLKKTKKGGGFLLLFFYIYTWSKNNPNML